MPVTVEDGRLKLKIANAKKLARSSRLTMIHAAAKGVINAEKAAMSKQLDRPTPFTINSMYYRVAVAGDKVAAIVRLKDKQREYLRHNIVETNDNKWKPIPIGKAKNKYGNLPRFATKRKRTFTMRANGRTLLAIRTGRMRKSIQVYAISQVGRPGTTRLKWIWNASDYLRWNRSKLVDDSVRRVIKRELVRR